MSAFLQPWAGVKTRPSGVSNHAGMAPEGARRMRTQDKKKLAGAKRLPRGSAATASAQARGPPRESALLGSPTSKLCGEHNDVRNAELPAPRGRPHASFGVNNAV